MQFILSLVKKETIASYETQVEEIKSSLESKKTKGFKKLNSTTKYKGERVLRNMSQISNVCMIGLILTETSGRLVFKIPAGPLGESKTIP